FTLTDVEAKVTTPAGLTPIRATIGADIGTVSPNDSVDRASIGSVAPGETGTAQFVVRGDSIGLHTVAVDFGGLVTAPGLSSPVPWSGRSTTDVQVFGPPELAVTVHHPRNPNGPDVVAGQIYTLIIDVTNRSDRPALYSAIDLVLGGRSTLVSDSGTPI